MADKLTAKDILSKFKKAFNYKAKLIDLYREDMEYMLGKQWNDDDLSTLDKAGVKGLTINKIRPNIQLIAGIEAQNRVDYRAFPKGEEDGLKADVLTSLIKNVMDESEMEYKQSEQFEEGLSCGDCYMEPYLDYTYDLINARLNWKKTCTTRIYPDPKSTEYDLSDGRYLCKLTTQLTKEELLEIFPEKESVINKIDVRAIDTINWNNLMTVGKNTNDNYHNDGSRNNTLQNIDETDSEPTYDLLEYYYKKQVYKTLIVDTSLKKMQVVEDEEKANQYAMIGNQQAPGSVRIVKRLINEIWLASLVGNTIISDERSWSYPRWDRFPVIPFFAYRSTADINNQEYLIQGIVRGMKDVQLDYNKRRTQELRHLNSSANSGWIIEEGSVSPNELDNYRQFGASPGMIYTWKTGRTKPEKIIPTPLSQGHAQLSAERTQEIKEISGINSDLLAMNESQASGRAIAIRQKQGLVMVQKLFDNNSRTKKIIGKFILSQLGEIFDVESAMKVMGDKWTLKNFGQPRMTGVDMQGQPLPELDQNGQIVLELTQESQAMATQFFNEILNDNDVAKYDVSIGEGVYSETVKYSNFLMLQEMAQSGMPIPPDVLVDESTLSSSTKDRIRAAIQSMQAQQPKLTS